MPAILVLAFFLWQSTPVSFIPHPATQDQHGFLEPQLFLPDNTTLFGDLAIARFLGTSPFWGCVLVECGVGVGPSVKADLTG